MNERRWLECAWCMRFHQPRYDAKKHAAHVCWWTKSDSKRIEHFGIYCAGPCLDRIERQLDVKANDLWLHDSPVDCFYREQAWRRLYWLTQDFEWPKEHLGKFIDAMHKLSKAKGPHNSLVELFG